MSPRPRTVDDATILAATGRVLTQLGPARLTLAAVAAAVGLAPATLVQRFGTKRGLLLAFSEQAVAAVEREFAAARATGRPPLDTLLDALIALTREIDTPEALANSLAFLQLDLSDAEFHRHARAHARALRAAIQALLERATESGELVPCDSVGLARAVHITFNGALLTWAIDGTGTLADWVQTAVDLCLQPYRAVGTS